MFRAYQRFKKIRYPNLLISFWILEPFAACNWQKAFSVLYSKAIFMALFSGPLSSDSLSCTVGLKRVHIVHCNHPWKTQRFLKEKKRVTWFFPLRNRRNWWCFLVVFSPLFHKCMTYPGGRYNWVKILRNQNEFIPFIQQHNTLVKIPKMKVKAATQ